ncbi:hypothetical protein GQ457_01G010710 [Hibiscus cannabinus]
MDSTKAFETNVLTQKEFEHRSKGGGMAGLVFGLMATAIATKIHNAAELTEQTTAENPPPHMIDSSALCQKASIACSRPGSKITNTIALRLQSSS